MLWKITLSYDGTSFNGWQVQPSLPTIQGTLANAIHHITGERILPQGSGRTDAGVHALAQVASFSLEAPIPPANLLRALNRALPPSIRVLDARHAPPNFHARHSAIGKTYQYRISTAPICSPMLAPFVWNITQPLDISALHQSASHILGAHDFTSFAASDPDLSTRSEQAETPCFTRTIHHSAWQQNDDLLTYTITGSGFLHHMVRNLVGTFIEAALGRISPHSLPTILAAQNRQAAGPTAPPQGLFLVQVDYPDL